MSESIALPPAGTILLRRLQVHLLAEHQAEQPEGYPYVFVPPRRYDNIQRVRQMGRWTAQKGTAPLNNF